MHPAPEGKLALEVGVVAVGEAEVAGGEEPDEDVDGVRVELVAGHAPQFGNGVGGEIGLR